jgi:WD40 repeat protein
VLCLNFTRTLEGVQRGGDDGAVIFHMNNDKDYQYAVNLGKVRALAMPADHSFVAYGFASGEFVGQVHQHRVPSGTNLKRLEGSISPVEQLAFSPFDETLAVVHRDGKVVVWDARNGKQLRSPPDSSVVAAAPGGPVLALARDKLLGFWDRRGHRWKDAGFEFPTAIRALAFVPDGKYLAVGEAGGDVTLWDVARKKQAHIFKGHQGEVLGLAVAPDGNFLATGGADGTARLWDVREALAAAGREKP